MRSLPEERANSRGALALITVGTVTAVVALTLTLGSTPAGGPNTALEAGAGIAPSPVDGRAPAPAAPRKLAVEVQDRPEGQNQSGTGDGISDDTGEDTAVLDTPDAETEATEAMDATAGSSATGAPGPNSDAAEPTTGNPATADPTTGNSTTGDPTVATPDSSAPAAPASTGPPATAKPPTTVTTRPTTTTTRPPTTTNPPTTPRPAPTGRFKTLPPGSDLPSGTECAARVRPTPENVPENTRYNQRRGHSVAGKTALSQDPAVAANTLDSRIDGNFVGTTDEIIQWGACKWGFDEDHIRAQAYAESAWFAGQLGDCGNWTQDRTNGCASVGLLQIKAASLPTPHHPGLWPIAWDSTALNIDYALGARRLCYEGLESWLADVDNHGVKYRAGDEWGCIARWYSGSWYDHGGQQYVERVKERLRQRRWETRFVGCPAWEDNHYCSDGGPRGF